MYFQNFNQAKITLTPSFENIIKGVRHGSVEILLTITIAAPRIIKIIAEVIICIKTSQTDLSSLRSHVQSKVSVKSNTLPKKRLSIEVYRS